MSPGFRPTAIPAVTFDAQAAARRRTQLLDPALRTAFVAEGEAVANLDRLYAPGALCVTTGQQPGLLTGPLYTIYKALSAVTLARALEEQLERPVVPVFWVAGDDHDFAEANHVHLLSGGHDVRRLVLRDREPDAPLTPMYRELVGPEIDAVLQALEADTPDSEFRPGVFEWIRRSYRPDTDMATAFAGALAYLLGRYGLVVFRPTDPAAKQAAAPWLMRALEEATALETLLERRVRRLEEEGLQIPVAVRDRSALVFIEATQGRDRLLIADRGFTTRRSQERWTFTTLEAVARTDPVRLSPNVLLRPVVEAALLPTIAYVAGPGELAYLPECDPIYAALGVAPQERVPRWSGQVLETHIAKVLDKYGLAPDALDAPEGQLEAQLVRGEMPADAADALRRLRDAVRAEYDRLAAASATVDPTLEKPVRSAGKGALRDLQDVEKRIISHLKKQNAIAVGQIAKARAHLFPLGKPQERVLNVVPFLTRYGPSFLDEAFVACTEWSGALETASGRT